MTQGDFNRNKTHCPQKHEYTEENTYINPQGRRQCRTCARANSIVQCFRKYGLTVDDVIGRLKEQDYKCKICRKGFSFPFDSLDLRDMQIDHDHKCCPPNKGCENCVRGLLCGECNRGIERFKDDSSRLRAAADYLDFYSNK